MSNVKVKDMTNKLIDEYVSISKHLKQLGVDHAACQAELESIFDEYYKNQKSLKSDKGNVVSLIKRLYITYDADLIEALLKKIDNEADLADGRISEGIVTRTIVIDDIAGLIEYLKSLGVDPKIFKSFISVNKKVNNSKVKELFDQNVIKTKELKKCIVKSTISKSIDIKKR